MAITNTKALHDATNWYVQLTSGTATEQDRQAWKEWLNTDPANKLAWQQVEEVTNCFMGLNTKTSMAVLNRRYVATPAINGRRQFVKNLGLLFAVSSAGWLTYKEKPWYHFMADYSTAKGEVQKFRLDDGSRLVLNTDTKVSIHFDEQIRSVRLLQGEVYVETSQETNPVYRPFIVQTMHGTVTALGTRFSTRIYNNRSCVNVFEDAVEVRPIDGLGDKVVVNAGEEVKFTSMLFQQKMLFDMSAADAWTKGFIIVDNMPLAKVIDELSRYRHGVVRCDPAIADLEISGAFPITDVDAALLSIAKTLSIRIESFTPYLVMLKPA
ncbi:FecR domain-containing protein [Methylophaga sp.]|jgi:transmembrane sensor|uniref:FecR domain-containing protein n=1 Tax=Methylophaga sp. TaxID=2024840 RepID=UPI003F6F30A1